MGYLTPWPGRGSHRVLSIDVGTEADEQVDTVMVAAGRRQYDGCVASLVGVGVRAKVRVRVRVRVGVRVRVRVRVSRCRHSSSRCCS